jgi:hypothetical protein
MTSRIETVSDRCDVDELLDEVTRPDPADLIGIVRARLDLDTAALSDVSIAASLAQIAAKSENRDRWLAAFGSPLGKHFAMRGSDLNTVLNTLLALAPRPQA